MKTFFLNDRTFFLLQGLLKYIPYQWGVSLRRKVYKPFFKAFGKSISIKDGTTFKYPSEISIGNNCTIGEFCYFVGKSGLTMGDDLLIGAGCKIITSAHLFGRRDIPIRIQGLDFKPIRIGNDIWMGFDVKIFGGVNVADGCIIGAGSIVNKNFEESYKIIAGVPAKELGGRP